MSTSFSPLSRRIAMVLVAAAIGSTPALAKARVQTLAAKVESANRAALTQPASVYRIAVDGTPNSPKALLTTVAATCSRTGPHMVC